MGHMEPFLVIKIIYGDSIRRITLFPDENGDVGLNMDGLSARILSLFKLDPDAHLTLTYIDEDNDIITLVDEDDLYDALRQPLNPLRITAKLNSCGLSFNTMNRDSSKVGIGSHLGIYCDRSKACSIFGPQLNLNYNHNQLQRSLGQLIQPDFGLKPCPKKLDSLFIQDRQVIDGTFIKPATPFTKIWRMRNNGIIVWPQEMQLMWIGGYQFTEKASVEIQVPGDGLHVDEELDIAVDFTAPDQPGRYTSYWRMALPSGYKFGQVIWVDIQVDISSKDFSTDRFYSSSFSESKEKRQKNVDVQITHDQPSHNQKIQSLSSTNVSKSSELDKASNMPKLNQSKNLEEKRFKEFDTKKKKSTRDVSRLSADLAEMELKEYIDVEKVLYKFMDWHDRKTGGKTKYRRK